MHHNDPFLLSIELDKQKREAARAGQAETPLTTLQALERCHELLTAAWHHGGTAEQVKFLHTLEDLIKRERGQSS